MGDKNKEPFPAASGLYDPARQHDSCGTGFIAKLDAVPSRRIVEDGVTMLLNLAHRGAVGGDTASGDGAGILIQIPHGLLSKKLNLPAPGEYAVGMVFLPNDDDLARRAERELESVAAQKGCSVIGWRDVPVALDRLGKLARSTAPKIRQVFLARGGVRHEDFERTLFIIRRTIENRIAQWTEQAARHFYIPSLSARTIVYKGMLRGAELAAFYCEDLADKHCESAFALVHERYSTNTFPSWRLAQPFRILGHNGEINTLRGNVNRMHAREAILASALFGDDIANIKPVIDETSSDSGMLDNMLELLVMGGRSLPHAIMMTVPEPWGTRFVMGDDRRAFYEYHAAIMEPWDGPAAIVFTDGRYVGGTLDRNGLRPARFTITRDGLVVLASETGVLDLPAKQILQRGRLQPGRMLLVDLDHHRVIPDNEIKSTMAFQKPYRRWVKKNRIELRGLLMPSEMKPEPPDVLRQKQHAFGYTEEELKTIIQPMAAYGQEAVGSMGNDAALAVLSDQPQLLFAYFKQLFAQVTNPPIDPLREELVMSLMSFIGRQRNLLEESPEHCLQLKLPHPILTPEDMQRLRHPGRADVVTRDIDILFPVNGEADTLERALLDVFAQAERHIAEGATIIALTDRNVSAERAAIPSLLATAGLHHHLIRRGLRTAASIVIETGEAREVIHFAQLISFGANAVCPYLALSTVREMAEAKLLDEELTPEDAMDSYITAVKKGLLKTFSRMGISTIRSFHGAQIFEAVGLSKEVIDLCFCGTASRVSGIGLAEIATEALERHRHAFPSFGSPPKTLPLGGDYRNRVGAERHLWTPEAIHALQQATRRDDYAMFKQFASIINSPAETGNGRITLRALMRFKQANPVPLDEVEPVEKIIPRFAGAAMSFGSLSKEAHEAIAVAFNHVGARSNSGEGGQLPGHKVSDEIARVRHTTPGVTLISPPPHHDIYSIEDIAQLIFDLRRANPKARVSVKLVSEVGVGAVAAGVAKARADMVLISGHDGGTGASPLTAIKHTGLPWELGLAEAHQTLVRNNLRDRIRVQTDGQLRTGRDLTIAAMLGAEEFGLGTPLIVTLGCVMMRRCHLNTCPVGVATQDPELRKRFAGKPEYVERFLRFLAQDLREQMAQLGFRTVDEMVGRSDMLELTPGNMHWKARHLDLSGILHHSSETTTRCVSGQNHSGDRSFDDEVLRLARPAIERGESVKIKMPVQNVNRTIGTELSGEIARRYGLGGLPDDTISIELTGSAGQCLGAFLSRGITIRVEGDANDYAGKGMSGGRIIVVPNSEATFAPHENIIIGNVVLYGATSGELYACGVAGERFGVRNSGASAVVEGVGDHGCEYMTGGIVVVLGNTGYNFAAGMSGGIAYVYNETGLFETRCNLDMVDLESVALREDVERLRHAIEQHIKYTDSPRAKAILENWETCLPLFVKVMPIDYRSALERMKMGEDIDRETLSATEEVFHR